MCDNFFRINGSLLLTISDINKMDDIKIAKAIISYISTRVKHAKKYNDINLNSNTYNTNDIVREIILLQNSDELDLTKYNLLSIFVDNIKKYSSDDLIEYKCICLILDIAIQQHNEAVNKY
jgi:hypothetical protein